MIQIQSSEMKVGHLDETIIKVSLDNSVKT